MDAIQRAIPVPQAEVIVHGPSGRQLLGQRAPLAAGAEQVHHAVNHLADIDALFAAAGLAPRDQRLDMRPLLIGQIARIAQLVAVLTRPFFISPRGAPHEWELHSRRNHNRSSPFKGVNRLTNSSNPRSLQTDNEAFNSLTRQ